MEATICAHVASAIEILDRRAAEYQRADARQKAVVAQRLALLERGIRPS
jgi:hypothetical protein